MSFFAIYLIHYKPSLFVINEVPLLRYLLHYRTGFEYSEQCPRDFKDEVRECYAEHLHKFTGSFQEDNNLVVKGKQKDLKDMCR